MPGSESLPSPVGLRPGSPEALQAAWADYFNRVAFEPPRHPAAREFLDEDLRATLRRWIPADASVVEVGCRTGDLITALPNQERVGIAPSIELAAEAQRRHPEISFEVGKVERLPPGRRFDAVICDRLCHTVTDVRAWLEGLRDRLTEHGLIYLTAFNYLWEFAAQAAEVVGWKTPAPTSNWLSHSDFHNLFNITGLEMVRFEDRLLLPLPMPGLAPLVNRYLAKLPVLQRFSL